MTGMFACESSSVLDSGAPVVGPCSSDLSSAPFRSHINEYNRPVTFILKEFVSRRSPPGSHVLFSSVSDASSLLNVTEDISGLGTDGASHSFLAFLKILLRVIFFVSAEAISGFSFKRDIM